MNKKKIQIEKDSFPRAFLPLLSGVPIYDSSCSAEAKVYYIERDGGYFLKVSEKGTLAMEAALDSYFHGKGIGARVVEYLSEEKDYLLTERVAGEDCTAAAYIAEPTRLCDIIATKLRELHSLDFSDCTVKNRTAEYIKTLETNYKKGRYDLSFLQPKMSKMTAEEAYALARTSKDRLECDTLIHGDYCLPNIMLDNWRFSGFIDLGNGGVGDRHIDIFWGAWTLSYNLKTDRFKDRFFDAYGRDAIDLDKLDLVASCEVFG